MAKRRRNGAVDPPSLEQLELPKRTRLSSAERDPTIASWSTEDVTEYLREQNVPERLLQAFEGRCVSFFLAFLSLLCYATSECVPLRVDNVTDHAIAGTHLLGLTKEDLTAIGVR